MVVLLPQWLKNNPYYSHTLSFLAGAAAAAFIATSVSIKKPALKTIRDKTVKASIARSHGVDYARLPVPDLGYRLVFKEPRHLEYAKLGRREAEIGRIQRALRWRPITRAVEKRYGIPQDHLLGMICVESFGDPLLPNSMGDGGLGLIHMNPPLTAEYGLKMITDSKRLRDYEQGRRIVQAIDLHNGELRKLIRLDDRFHPVKNLDAAGRILADFYEETCSWEKALELYSGQKQYDSWVMHYVRRIRSPDFIGEVVDDFNHRNRNTKTSGGRPLNYDRYLADFYAVAGNYLLDEYQKAKPVTAKCYSGSRLKR